MTEPSSRRERLVAALSSPLAVVAGTSLALVAAAVALGAVGGIPLTALGPGPAFLLLFTVGVGVPQAYRRYWPRTDSRVEAAGWTLVVAAAATAVFLVGLAVAVPLLGERFGAAAAFLATYVVLFAGVQFVGRRLVGEE